MKVLNGFTLVDGIRMDAVAEVDGGMQIDETKVAVMHRENMAYVQGPPTNFIEGEGFFRPFLDFCEHAESLRINLNYPIGGLHKNMQSFSHSPGEPDYFFSMDPTGNKHREAGNYLIGFAVGHYGQFGDLAERMRVFAKKNNLAFSGPVYTLYLHDETCVIEPDQYLSQVCVAVS
jgi:hypothetical protein